MRVKAIATLAPAFCCLLLPRISQAHTRGLVAGTYPLVCTHQKIDRFVGLLVPATSPRNQTSLIRGTSRRDQKCGPCHQNFVAKYQYTLGIDPRSKSLRPIPQCVPSLKFSKLSIAFLTSRVVLPKVVCSPTKYFVLKGYPGEIFNLLLLR